MERERRKKFGEGIYICAEEKKMEKKRRKIFGEGKYLENEKDFFWGEGKRVEYLEKENTLLQRRRNMEKEKEENIWWRKIFFGRGEEKRRRKRSKRRKIFGEGKYFVFEENKTEKEKEEKFVEGKGVTYLEY